MHSKDKLFTAEIHFAYNVTFKSHYSLKLFNNWLMYYNHLIFEILPTDYIVLNNIFVLSDDLVYGKKCSYNGSYF